VKAIRTPHLNAEDDPWTISPEDHERPGDEEGIDTDRPATRARIGSNPASTADERRLEKERTKEQRATTRVRIPVAAGTSDSIFLMDGVVGMGSPQVWMIPDLE
jgi:hypothetical protein